MDKIAMQIRLVKIEELSYRDKTKLGEALKEPVFVKKGGKLLFLLYKVLIYSYISSFILTAK